ncbi:hypothetical protein ET495_07550 [Xylanimonas allomyrinae]|uniref:Uncharacterized protein n=1 Tax=Xylanimonas allomyrinae TaxID=2509459 RepID=A0A4P6EKJ8_9MICO|nr:DUF6221 family protein [Xylanimonas allomyrinae]QAY63124.1 hypothetical protein ET495_07550 [Xylanimonas allomyrinae]
MTLSAFLTARLDEDEARAVAEELRRGSGALDETHAGEVERTFTPARLKAEVDAKRRLLRLAYEATGLDMDKDLERAVNAREDSGVAFVGERMLQALALPYADHPDYDEAWRP